MKKLRSDSRTSIDEEETAEWFSTWFKKRYRGRYHPNRTAWHFFDFISRVEVRDKTPTERMRRFRQDCMAANVKSTWRNAVKWHARGGRARWSE